MNNFDAITQTCADCGETYKTRYCDVCNDVTVPNGHISIDKSETGRRTITIKEAQ